MRLPVTNTGSYQHGPNNVDIAFIAAMQATTLLSLLLQPVMVK